MDSLDSLDKDREELLTESLEERDESTQHISDVLVTQTILCIAIVTGVFVLNVFKPDISAYLISNFKYHTTVEFSETVRSILAWLYDRV
jgi:hypothetical protein